MDLLDHSKDTHLRRKKTFVLTFDDGYEDFFTNAYPILRRYRFTATVFLVTDFIGGRSKWEGEKGSPMLTWEEIRVLHENGISFGTHTCAHNRLTRLSNKQLNHELITSKALLEAELGTEISLLAYPYGESNGEIQKIAMALGYRAACGVNTGRNGRFNLWRCPCFANDNIFIFAFKLSPWYRQIISLRRWIREETAFGRYLRKIKRRWFPNENWRPE